MLSSVHSLTYCVASNPLQVLRANTLYLSSWTRSYTTYSARLISWRGASWLSLSAIRPSCNGWYVDLCLHGSLKSEALSIRRMTSTFLFWTSLLVVCYRRDDLSRLEFRCRRKGDLDNWESANVRCLMSKVVLDSMSLAPLVLESSRIAAISCSTSVRISLKKATHAYVRPFNPY